ncbi:MAG: iron chaperone [Actinomycetota bacterium]
MSDQQRAALQELRETIRAAAPDAEECISYQLAAFRQGGMLVAFGATAKHCAFYLMSSSTVEAHQDELRAYDTSKGTIRFQAHQPLPAALVRKLVAARLAENETARRGKSASRAVRKAAADPDAENVRTDPAPHS